VAGVMALHRNANIRIIKEHVKANKRQEEPDVDFQIANLTRFAYCTEYATFTPISKILHSNPIFLTKKAMRSQIVNRPLISTV
jgi:hypothetical protein